MADYSTECRTMAAENKWNTPSLYNAITDFLMSLKTNWKLESPHSWMHSSPWPFASMAVFGSNTPEPMQLSRTQCLYCGQTGHIFCLVKGGSPVITLIAYRWTSPRSRQCHKEPQHFLGFDNFYHRFIQSYSSVVAPHTALTTQCSPYVWSKAADKALGVLKPHFKSAPILTFLDPSQQVDPRNLEQGCSFSRGR